MVETFREYFQGILNGPELSTFSTLNNRTFDSPLESVDFTIPDIKKRLRTCNPYSSIGLDNVHPRILKEAADALDPTLTSLFKKCIEDGQISSVRWEATITPIYKKGSRHSPFSYRSISLTSIPCKIFEKVIKEKMLKHLQSNNNKWWRLLNWCLLFTRIDNLFIFSISVSFTVWFPSWTFVHHQYAHLNG